MHYYRDVNAMKRMLPALLQGFHDLDRSTLDKQQALLMVEMRDLVPAKDTWTPFERERFYHLELRHLLVTVELTNRELVGDHAHG